MKLTQFILFMLAGTSLLFATGSNYKTANSYIVSNTDSLTGDLFYAGRYLEVEGQADGDIIAGAQRTIISGDVSDDVYAWCEEIRVEGNVGDLLLGFAKEITIKGTVHGDVIAYGGRVRILKDAEILGNLYVGTANLYIDRAHIAGKIKGGAAKVFLNGSFSQDIDLGAKDVEFGDNFSSTAGVQLTLREKPEQPLKNAPANLEIMIKPMHYFFVSFIFWWFFISALVIGLIMMAFFPGFFQKLTTLSRTKLAAVSGSGALFLILTPIAAIFAILFLPLAFILVALFAIILYLSKIFAAFIMGDYLIRKIIPGKNMNRYLIFILGFILLTLLIKIPFVGFLIGFLAIFLGSGSFVYHLFSIRKNGNTNAL